MIAPGAHSPFFSHGHMGASSEIFSHESRSWLVATPMRQPEGSLPSLNGGTEKYMKYCPLNSTTAGSLENGMPLESSANIII